ncbi:4-hydroxy-tetrahydrodipicolinate synthase [Pseudomonas sp. NPDC007930]|uniref:4-hydroxy-tetrahydrodipicolinate synthase n=1 Tax=Pseudomonas sp. NPDC007930 TaxID=3364417 RepID=UPI0036E2FDB1
MSVFKGIWVPLVTPFRRGEIDFQALRALVEKLLAEEVQGLVVCGTTGEAAALSAEEQLHVLDAVLQWAPPARVVMGLAGNHLPGLLAFLQAIQQRPLAGLLVPAPYYIRPSQAALEGFFDSVASAARVPVILYDIPARTGARIDRETLLRIVRHPNIAAVKDCAGDLGTTLALIASGQVDVLAGEDLQIFNTLCLGGSGAISASAHIGAPLFNQLYRQTLAGELAAARRTFYRLLPWIEVAFREPNPAVVKAALSVQGVIGHELRLPMLGCSEATLGGLPALLAGLREAL